jgi:hypothetical protein
LVVAIAALAALVAPISASAAGSAGWHFAKTYAIPHAGGVDGLACPTVNECLAVNANKVFWTTNAAGGKRTWHHVALEPQSQPDVQGEVDLDDISCGSAHLCVIADDIGNVFVASNPTGGKAAWAGHDVDDIEILTVGCSAAGACAGIDYYGHLLSTTNPAGVWRASSTTLNNDPSIWGVSCAGKSLCAAVAGSAKIATTTDPGAAAPTWHLARVPGVWADISCPTTGKCVAVGGYEAVHGKIAVSTSPAHGGWKTAKLSHSGPNKIDCASASACFADNDYSSTHVVAKTSAWSYVSDAVRGASQTALSCPTAKRCYLGAINGFSVGKR